MRITISSAYPADDLFAYFGIVACLAFIVLAAVLIIAERVKKNRQYKGRHYVQMQNYAAMDVELTLKAFESKDLLRLHKEQDAKDQETLDRATEYRNGI